MDEKKTNMPPEELNDEQLDGAAVSGGMSDQFKTITYVWQCTNAICGYEEPRGERCRESEWASIQGKRKNCQYCSWSMVAKRIK